MDSITREGVTYTLPTLGRTELMRLRVKLLQDRLSIESQLTQSDGHDPRWESRANHAFRLKGIQIMAIDTELGKRDNFNERAYAFLQAFKDVAEAILPDGTYLRIYDQAQANTALKESVTNEEG